MLCVIEIVPADRILKHNTWCRLRVYRTGELCTKGSMVVAVSFQRIIKILSKSLWDFGNAVTVGHTNHKYYSNFLYLRHVRCCTTFYTMKKEIFSCMEIFLSKIGTRREANNHKERVTSSHTLSNIKVDNATRIHGCVNGHLGERAYHHPMPSSGSM